MRLPQPTTNCSRQALTRWRFGAFAGRRVQVTAATHQGRRLAAALQAVEPGRDASREFEDACIRALRYLFEPDLRCWRVQLTTEDNLQRRDLACRIVPAADVWRQMWSLNSHYLVFEFKNHTNRITQKEVRETERYLCAAAKRLVAIIISPQGSASSAEAAISGAMREGKLIISLSVDELAAWLIMKDRGADPNAFLSERVDEFFLTLGR